MGKERKRCSCNRLAQRLHTLHDPDTSIELCDICLLGLLADTEPAGTVLVFTLQAAA